jgi:hypothetical protein
LKTSLFYDGYNITNEERMLFLCNKSSFLFHSYQYRTIPFPVKATKATIDLNFVGCVSEIVICIVPNFNIHTNNNFSYEPLKSITLNFDKQNGQLIDACKYRLNKQYNNIPDTWIYSIPFCLSSLQTQPSGYKLFHGKQGKEFVSIERIPNQTESNIFLIAKTLQFISTIH